KLGVPTPEAVFPTSRHDVTQFLKHARFPIMLKSVDSEVLRQRPHARSTIRVCDAKTVLQLYERMEVPGTPNLMLQEYIPGGLGSHWMVSAYFNEPSECLFAITGQKLRESRPGAGFTTLGVFVRNRNVEQTT